MNNESGTIHWARKCYGIDFHENLPVAVCCDKTRGAGFFSQISVEDDQFKSDLEKGVPCAASLSSRESLMCRVAAPFDSPRKAKKVFPTLLDIQLPFPLEDCVYEFLAPQSKAGGFTALAVAGRESDLEKKLGLLLAFGVDPHVLDHEGLALWTQAIKEVPIPAGSNNEWRVVINLNGTASSITIGRGEELLNCHSVSGDNGGQIHRLLKSCMVSAKDSADSDDRKIHWIWAGSGSSATEKVSFLRSVLDQSFEGEHFVVEKPELFLARALAVRALFPGPLRCNLRKGIISHGGVLSHSKRRFALGVALFLISGAVLCISNLFVRGLIGAKEEALNSSFYKIASEVAGYDIRGLRGEHVVREVRAQVNKRKLLLSPFVASVETSLLDEVSAIMSIADNFDLSFAAIQLDKEEIMITGSAPGWSSCDELLVYLKRKGYQVSEDNLDRTDAQSNGRISFRIMSGRVR